MLQVRTRKRQRDRKLNKNNDIAMLHAGSSGAEKK
jgi:hypothetical protein